MLIVPLVVLLLNCRQVEYLLSSPRVSVVRFNSKKPQQMSNGWSRGDSMGRKWERGRQIDLSKSWAESPAVRYVETKAVSSFGFPWCYEAEIRNGRTSFPGIELVDCLLQHPILRSGRYGGCCSCCVSRPRLLCHAIARADPAFGGVSGCSLPTGRGLTRNTSLGRVTSMVETGWSMRQHGWKEKSHQDRAPAFDMVRIDRHSCSTSTGTWFSSRSKEIGHVAAPTPYQPVRLPGEPLLSQDQPELCRKVKRHGHHVC